jgi:hypothetical protein
MNKIEVRFNEIRAGFGTDGGDNKISLAEFRALTESEASLLIDRINDGTAKVELQSMRGDD